MLALRIKSLSGFEQVENCHLDEDRGWLESILLGEDVYLRNDVIGEVCGPIVAEKKCLIGQSHEKLGLGSFEGLF